MGKLRDVELAAAATATATAASLEIGGGGTGSGGGGGIAVAIAGAVTLRCALVLVLGVGVFLSALFVLPFFRAGRHAGYVSNDPDVLAAEIKASFTLEKPVSFLTAHSDRLEYDIFEEIGVPNSKVSIVSMRPLASSNSTYVVFGVLPDPKYTSVTSPALSVLRSSLIEMVLQQLNLSLTPSLFGHPSSFELLRFPGGITVIPVQPGSTWDMTQVLFNFALNNSIYQILKNLDELKEQLKFGLDLRSYENVYVQLTNEDGATATPPATVEASVLSGGSVVRVPGRLKQLAQLITRPDTKNLGLNHSVFGRVKGVQLSSYLQHSISSPAPGPSPSPSPSLSSPTVSPSPSPSEGISYPSPPSYMNPAYAPHAPSSLPSKHHSFPCFSCECFTPSESPTLNSPYPVKCPESPSQFMHSPQPSVIPSPSVNDPCISPVFPPSSPPENHPPPQPSPDHLPNAVTGPTSQMPPKLSPSSPRSLLEGSSSTIMSPSVSPSLYSRATASPSL